MRILIIEDEQEVAELLQRALEVLGNECVHATGADEAARALEEEVVVGPRELDLATVFGMGFAPFRGGLLRYADARGLSAIVERLRVLCDSPAIAERAPRRITLRDGRIEDDTGKSAA